MRSVQRIAISVRLYAQLLWRHGFVYAAVASVVVWWLVLEAVSPAQRVWLAPLVVFSDIALVGFYIIGGLHMLARSDGTLWALQVTPLRFHEWLTAIVGVLTMLALALSAILWLLLPDWRLNLIIVLLATASMAIISLIYGYIVALPYRDFSTFLIPSQFYAVLLFVPFANLVWPTTSNAWWWWMLPTYPAWHLLTASQPQLVAASVGSAVWCLVLARWAAWRTIHSGGARV
jgi:fluoroquinolone transport system permease protein